MEPTRTGRGGPDTVSASQDERLLPRLLHCSNSAAAKKACNGTLVFGKPSAERTINADSNNNCARAAPANDQGPRLWSQNPVINVLAAHLIVQRLDQEKRKRTQQQQQEDSKDSCGAPSELDHLVHSVLRRLDQPENSKNEKLAQDYKSVAGVKNTPQNPHAPYGSGFKGGSDGTGSTASETRSNGSSDEEERTIVLSNYSRNSSREEQSDDDESCTTSDSTRQELALALRQHLSVLRRRGQDSLVVPSFFGQAKTPPPLPQDSEEDDGSDASSCAGNSTDAVRSVKRRRVDTAKDRYYAELAAELVSAPPIPETIALGVDSSTGLHNPMAAEAGPNARY